MATDELLLFLAAGLLLNLTPGPDVLCVVGHALRSGVRAGMVAACGVAAGCCVHIGAAAVGVGALLAASGTAFALLKWAGAAYLAYVGLRMLRAQPRAALTAAAEGAGAASARGFKGIFWRGFWTNALNPKVALFFLAFVPQFIAPGTAHPALAFVLLGVLFNANGLAVNLGWALAGAWLGRASARVGRTLQWLERGAGLLFLGFGARLALSDAPGGA